MIDNAMDLNINKCKQMTIVRQRNSTFDIYQELEPVVSLCILGVIWQSDLSWNAHFSRVLTTATQRLYALRQLRNLLPKKALLEIYHAQVLSVILYATPLFGELPKNIAKKITQLERRAHRIVCNKWCECSFTQSCCERRIKLSLKFLSKCEIPDHPLNMFVPPKMTNTKHYRLQYARTERRLNTFFHWACRTYNSKH